MKKILSARQAPTKMCISSGEETFRLFGMEEPDMLFEIYHGNAQFALAINSQGKPLYYCLQGAQMYAPIQGVSLHGAQLQGCTVVYLYLNFNIN